MSSLALYAAFAATGVGLVLPGALLSALLQRWSLTDQQAGVLFFLFFIGSTTGALLARGALSRTIPLGCLCTALGAYGLAICSRGMTFLAVLLFGAGLGITMTSVSLMQSRRYPATRAVEMTRLNLLWACGACAGPAILLRGAAQWSTQAVLYGVAGGFLMLAALTLPLLAGISLPAPATLPVGRALELRAWPWLLMAVVPLATGVESSVGGWLEAYSGRSGLMLNATISTVTCFWAGILLSRLVQSHRGLASATQGAALRTAPWLMSGALLAILMNGIVANHRGWYMPAAALVLGVGIGPVYPLMLAAILAYGEAGNLVFVIAGVGAASLPLLTGVVSGWTGSLAAGLTVPLAGSLAMAMLAMLARRRRLLAS